MQYRLHTLMIVLAILPPMLAVSWHLYQRHLARQRIIINGEIFTPIPRGSEFFMEIINR